MKRLTILGIIVCLGLLVGSAVVIGSPAGPPEGLDVTVVRPLPLPVTGDVNATVSGDVSVTSMPDVTVINDEANPVPVRNVSSPTIQPVVVHSDPCLFGDGIPVCTEQLFTVPEGKCLIVEYVSAAAAGADSDNVRFLTISVTGGMYASIPIGNFQTGTSSPPEHFISKPVRIYAPSGTTVSARATIYPFADIDGGSVEFDIQGQLVDLE